MEEVLHELREHAAPDGTVTILFSDMEGYTEMTERLGDIQAREILYVHNQIIREKVTAVGGFVNAKVISGFGASLSTQMLLVGFMPLVGAMGANDAYFGEPAVSTPEHGEILWSTLVEIWQEAIKAEMG